MITTREHRYPWKGRKRWPNGGRKPARIKHPLSHPLEISIISDVTLIDVISSAASVYWIDDSYYGISVRVSNCRYRYVVHFITIVYYQGQRSVKNLSTAWGSQSLLNSSSGNEVRSSFLFYFLFSSLCENKFLRYSQHRDVSFIYICTWNAGIRISKHTFCVALELARNSLIKYSTLDV